MIEKLEMSLTEVSEGIDICLEESTPAEDYFSQSSSSAGCVDHHFTHDLLDHVTEKCDDDDYVRQSKSLSHIEETKSILRDSSKRFSCTSKTSSDSTQSREKSQSVEPESLSLCDSELTEEKVQLDSIDGAKETRQTDDISQQQKINWQKAEGTFEISKKNVEILRKNAEMQGVKFLPRKTSQERKRHFDRLHPFHTHMLLYYGVYDTKQVLYAFQTLRNVIASDCRTFLCLSITSSMSNSPMKQLLVRHRKSIFGKGFSGNIINTEFNNVYRGCMYLEVLVTCCLYYARSFFQKEAADISKLPTSEDINGNCKVQLASIELLTMICTELLSIVKDMGRGLACYMSDLMAKCKLQKILLHCLISCVHSFQFKNDLTFTESILVFNEQGHDKMHMESVQVQLLRLLLSVIKLEFEVTCQKGEDSIKSAMTQDGASSSPTRVGPSTPTNVKYLPNCPISQQPMFLSAVLKALQSDHLRHLHRNWTDVITSSLNCFAFGSLTNIVISVIHQICSNIDQISRAPKTIYIPPDYAVTQLEAVTVLCHYCLLDNSQQTSLTHLFNQTYPQISSSAQSSNTGQLLNNIVHGKYLLIFFFYNSQQKRSKNTYLGILLGK